MDNIQLVQINDITYEILSSVAYNRIFDYKDKRTIEYLLIVETDKVQTTYVVWDWNEEVILCQAYSPRDIDVVVQQLNVTLSEAKEELIKKLDLYISNHM